MRFYDLKFFILFKMNDLFKFLFSLGLGRGAVTKSKRFLIFCPGEMHGYHNHTKLAPYIICYSLPLLIFAIFYV